MVPPFRGPAAPDPIALTQALIRCPSVTPADAGALAVLEAALAPLGFRCERMRFEAPGTAPIDNLYARIGSGRPHLCFAGHTDVVPPGDECALALPALRGPDRRGPGLGPRRLRHEERGRRLRHRRRALPGRAGTGIRRVDQPAGHRRRGGRGGQRHGEDAAGAGGARRGDRCLHRRRAQQQRGGRRHHEDRPARQPDRPADRARRTGPCRLSAQSRQPLAPAGADAGGAEPGPGARDRRGQRPFRSVDPRHHHHRCRQPGRQCDPGRGPRCVQHPFQRHLDGETAWASGSASASTRSAATTRWNCAAAPTVS